MPSGPFMAFDQRGAGAAPTTTSERVNIAAGVRRGDENEMERTRDGRAGGNRDHGAVAHERGVERERRRRSAGATSAETRRPSVGSPPAAPRPASRP